MLHDQARLEGPGARVPRHDQAHAAGAARRRRQGLKIRLFDGLGEIYRSRLKHYQSATPAFEVAPRACEPDNLQRAEILAELYLVAGPDYTDKAVAEHQMLHQATRRSSTTRTRRCARIYMDSHQYDKTWCVCNTLAFLKKADPEELQFYEQYRAGLVRAKQRITDEIWAKLVHPDEDRYIGAIFGAVWQAVALLKAQPHKDFGLKRKDKRQLQSDPLMFSKLFYYVTQVLNVPLPEVFLRPEQPRAWPLANATRRASCSRRSSSAPHLLQGRPENELAFPSRGSSRSCGPSTTCRLRVPTNTELKVVFLAALKLVQPRFPVHGRPRPSSASTSTRCAARVPPAVLEQLALVVQRFMQTKAEADINKWTPGRRAHRAPRRLRRCATTSRPPPRWSRPSRCRSAA